MLKKALIGLNDLLLGATQRLCSDKARTRDFKVRGYKRYKALGDESKLGCVATRQLA